MSLANLRLIRSVKEMLSETFGIASFLTRSGRCYALTIKQNRSLLAFANSINFLPGALVARRTSRHYGQEKRAILEKLLAYKRGLGHV